MFRLPGQGRGDLRRSLSAQCHPITWDCKPDHLLVEQELQG